MIYNSIDLFAKKGIDMLYLWNLKHKMPLSKLLESDYYYLYERLYSEIFKPLKKKWHHKLSDFVKKISYG